MSMVIVNGFRMEGLDLLLLHQRIASFRQVVGAMANDAYAALISRMACKVIDQSYADGKPWTPSPAWHARSIVEDKRRELASSPYRNPTYDFGFAVHFVPDVLSRCIHGIVSCERSDWISAWMDQPFVEPYAYWDNTDRDKDVPALEWRRRRNAWARLIPRTSIRDEWMTAEMAHTGLFAETSRLVDLQPTQDDRRHAIASDRLIAEEMERLGGNASMESMMKAMGTLGTAAGRTRLAEIAERVRIPARIDERMLAADARPPMPQQGD